MRIVLYGGSFNPPHLGHLHAARAAEEALQPDLFLVVPDRVPPHKELAENSPSPEERMEMCKIAFRSLPSAEISNIELERIGKSYTADTVADMRKRFPADELVLVIGSDMLLSFRQWYNYRYILSECTLAVAEREDGESDELEQMADLLRREDGARIVHLIYKPYPASSTEIREELASGRCPAGLDPEVYRYIRENKFYLAG